MLLNISDILEVSFSFIQCLFCFFVLAAGCSFQPFFVPLEHLSTDTTQSPVEHACARAPIKQAVISELLDDNDNEKIPLHPRSEQV